MVTATTRIICVAAIGMGAIVAARIISTPYARIANASTRKKLKPAVKEIAESRDGSMTRYAMTSTTFVGAIGTAATAAVLTRAKIPTNSAKNADALRETRQENQNS